VSELTYLDFDLQIYGTEGNYSAQVLASPAGQAQTRFTSPFDDKELEIFYLRIGRPRRGVRSLDSVEMETAREYGGKLFKAVFDEEIYACYRSSLTAAEKEGKGLRIRLHETSPDLCDLPWEYLYNPSIGRFLALSTETPVVRYLDLPHPPQVLSVTPPLKMLVMISRPHNLGALDGETEWARLQKALEPLVQQGLLTVERIVPATLSALQRVQRRGDYHIIHFIGHGDYDERAEDGVLILEDDSGNPRPWTGKDLGAVLEWRNLRLMVLNACEGARTSRNDPFAGVARSLVQQGLTAVIAMQFEITDQAAITFAHEFYLALADGYPVDAALVEARRAIFAQGNDIEWGTPVYFTRAPDGRIFDILPSQALPLPPPKEPAHPVEPPQAGERGIQPPALLSKDAHKQAEKHYEDGLSAIYLGDLARAEEILQKVLSTQPDHQAAAEKLEQVKGQINLNDRYQQAQTCIEKQDWAGARKLLEPLVEEAPKFRDVGLKLKEVKKHLQLEELYEDARRLSAANEWQAVLNAFKRIHKLDPQYADPNQLLATAQRGYQEQSRQERLDSLYHQALQAMEAENWQEAAKLFKQVEAELPNYRDTRALLGRVSAQVKTETGVSRPAVKARTSAQAKTALSAPIEWIAKNIKSILITLGSLLGILVIGYILIFLRPWQPKTLVPEATEAMTTQTPGATKMTADGTLMGTLPMMTIQASGQTLRAVAFSPDDTLLASAGEEQIISIWDAEYGSELYHETAHADIITSLVWSPDGTWLASGSDDHTIRVWDIATTDEVKTLLGHEDFVLSIAWSPSGQWLASGGREYRLIVWNIDEESIVSSLTTDTSIYGVSWSPDERYVAASTRGSVLIVDPATGSIVQELPAGEGDNIAVAWSPDAQYLAAGGQDMVIYLWKSFERHDLTGSQSTITALAWSPDSQYLASTSFDNKIRIWDAGTGDELADRLAMPQSASTLFSLDWSSDGSRLAGAGADGEIFTWDTSDLESSPMPSPTAAVTPTLPEPSPTPVTNRFDAPVGTAEERAAPMEDGRCWPGEWVDVMGFLTYFNLGYSSAANLNLNTPTYNSDHNAPVFTIADGMVVYAGEVGSYNMMVIIRHEGALVRLPDGTLKQMPVYVRYAVLGSPLLVSEGENVLRGQQIGTIGNLEGTENSFLYFDISYTDLLVETPMQGAGESVEFVRANFVDPCKFLIDNHK
jgi:WD40 repeat protein/tetratricopeptide (TPR) repeat protein